MLLADEPLSLLIDKLDGLPRPDRIAILARLTQRERVLVAQSRTPPVSDHGFSVDVTSRIATLGEAASPMTTAAQDALRRATASSAALVGQPVSRSASLAEVTGRFFKPGHAR